MRMYERIDDVPIEAITADRLRRFAMFALVGLGGAVVNLGTLHLLMSVGVYYLFAGVVAVELAVLFNFFGNFLWTFRDSDVSGVKGVVRALVRDHQVRGVGMGLNIVALYLLVEVVGLYPLVAQALGALVAVSWNFGGNLVWTWK